MRVVYSVLVLALAACGSPPGAIAQNHGYRSVTPDQFGISRGDRSSLAGLVDIHISPDGRLAYLDLPSVSRRGFGGGLGRGAIVSMTCFDHADVSCAIDVVDALQPLKFAGWSADSERLYLIEKDALSELIVSDHADGPLMSAGDVVAIDHELAFTYRASLPLDQKGVRDIGRDWTQAWRRIERDQPENLTVWETTITPSGDLAVVYEDQESLRLRFKDGAAVSSGASVTTPWLHQGRLLYAAGRLGFASDGMLILEQAGEIEEIAVPWAARPVLDSATGLLAGVHTPQLLYHLTSDFSFAPTPIELGGEIIVSAQMGTGAKTLLTLQDAEGEIRHCVYARATLSCLEEARARSMVTTLPPSGDHGGAAFSVLRGESPSAKAILFFHGGPAGSSAYLPDTYLYGLLRSSGWDLILAEYSGSASFGAERARAFTHAPIREMQSDMPAVSRRIRSLGYDKIAVAGASFGAIPAMLFAEHDDLAACSILLVPYLKYRPASEWTRQASGGGFGPSYQHRVDQARMGGAPEGVTAFANDLDRLVRGWEPKGPVWMLFGESDPVSQPSDMLSAVQVSTVVAPGGHDLAHTTPEASRLVDEALSRCGG